MTEFKSNTIYFKKPGRVNTERTLDLAAEFSERWKIHQALVATTTGYTGALAVERFKDVDITVVTHATGYKGPNTQELLTENREKIEKGGGKILTAQHSFGGVNRAIRAKTGTYFPDEIIADVFRIFCAGMKVNFEIAMMAADAGLVQAGEPIIAVSGTHRGADTAALMIPANTFDFFNIQFLELICMPAAQHPSFK